MEWQVHDDATQYSVAMDEVAFCNGSAVRMIPLRPAAAGDVSGLVPPCAATTAGPVPTVPATRSAASPLPGNRCRRDYLCSPRDRQEDVIRFLVPERASHIPDALRTHTPAAAASQERDITGSKICSHRPPMAWIIPFTMARGSGSLPALQEDKKKKTLVPDAVVPAAEVVLREELAGRAEAAYLLHARGR